MRRLSDTLRAPVTVLLLLSQAAFAQQDSSSARHPATRASQPQGYRAVASVRGGHSFGAITAAASANRPQDDNSSEITIQEEPFAPPFAQSPEVTNTLNPPPVPPIPVAPASPGVHLNDSQFRPAPPFPEMPHPNSGLLPEGLPHGNAAELSVNRQWSFNFQNAPWITVLRTFAKEAGFSLQMAADPEGDFTYFDDNLYSQTEVLDLFNDHLLSTGRILVRDGRRLTLTNATADIPGNLIPFVPIQMVDGLGRNELASVAIPLRNTDPMQALEEIRQLQSPLGQVKALTNSGRVIVTDTGSYLRRMRDLLLGSGVAAGDGQAYVYQLKHAQAEDVAKAITDFLSQNGAGGMSADGVSAAGSFSDSGQRVVAEKTTNSLLVRGSTEEMGTIQRIIDELDRAPREVLVQALLVEVELGNTNELGVELGFQDSVLFDRSVVDKLVTVSQTTTAPNGTQTTNQSIISQTSAPGFNFNNQPLGNNTAASPSKVAAQSLSNFGVGRVNGDLGFGGLVLSAGSESVNVLLRALDAHFNIDVLSRPQVRAVENHEAFIQIGQQVPVVDGVAITPVGSANPVIRQDQAGIILKVTPRISPGGRVQLDVNAEKSAFNLAPGTGVPIFTDATNGNVIEAPIKDVTTADTTVSIQSGQTIVLGGMITNDQTVVVRKVPWLGDIPVIGRLFRYDLNRHRRKELLVFLTPTVLEGDEHSEYLKGREVELLHMPSEAFSFGDNLTGIYHGEVDPHVIPMGQISRTRNNLPESGTISANRNSLPRPGADVQPAAHSINRSNEPPSMPLTGHSGNIRQASASATQRRSSFQIGNADSSQASVQSAAFIAAPDEVTKKKSLWARSPNFRGFGRSQSKSAGKEPTRATPGLQPVDAPRPMPQASPRQFPQPQLSPELLQYQQSRVTGQRR